MTAQKTRMGLIGTGRIGQLHAANIAANPDTELAWVADPFVEGARAIATRFGGTPTSDTAQVLDPEKVDAVLVASPTPTHIDLIESCVDLGLAVLCEKPIDLDISRVNALRAKVASSDVPVALGFNQRFDPGFAEAHRRVSLGEIGDVEHLTIVSRDVGAPPESYIAVSGGIFRDMTIHDFDMARFFLGDVVEVSATGSCLFDEGARRHGDYDTVVVSLKAGSGAIATIINSRHSAIGYEQRLEAFGAAGVIQVANGPSSLVSRSGAAGVETKSPYVESFLERYAAAYAAELAEFVKLTRGEASTSPAFEDGRAALIIADAAQRAAKERSIVPIDAD